jgi:hypothetical protein
MEDNKDIIILGEGTPERLTYLREALAAAGQTDVRVVDKEEFDRLTSLNDPGGPVESEADLREEARRRFIAGPRTRTSVDYSTRPWVEVDLGRREREAWNRAVEEKKHARRARRINNKWKA